MRQHNIKDIVEKELKKTPKGKKQTVSFTLSKNTIHELTNEAKRLRISKSFLVEMILANYMSMPITIWKKKIKREVKNNDNKNL